MNSSYCLKLTRIDFFSHFLIGLVILWPIELDILPCEMRTHTFQGISSFSVYSHQSFAKHTTKQHCLKILPKIKAKKINKLDTFASCRKKNQRNRRKCSCTENQSQTNRCHRHSINLGKRYCARKLENAWKSFNKIHRKKKTIYSSWIFKCLPIVCPLWHGHTKKTQNQNLFK